MKLKKISKPSFETWLKTTKPVSLQDNTLLSVYLTILQKIGCKDVMELITDNLKEVTNNDQMQVKF